MESLLQLDQASGPTQLASIAEAYLGILLPGTVTDFWQVYKAAAAGGETYENGRRVTPLQEFLAQISGTKINTTDVDWAFTKLYNFRGKQRMDAELFFTKLLKGRSTISEKDFREDHEKMQGYFRQLAKEVHYDYMAHRTLVGNTEAKLHLEGHKSLPPELKDQARTGEVLNWIPSNNDLDAMDEGAMIIREGETRGRSKMTRRELMEDLILDSFNRAHQPIEGGALDVDEVDIDDVLKSLKLRSK